MPKQVVMGAILKCTFGAAPSALVVLPVHRVVVEGRPAANIMDHIPLVNIMPFGMCSSLANPAVASATAAALGVLTPMPCLPATAAPWAIGAPDVLIDMAPALDDIASCPCSFGGLVQIADPGTTRTMVP